MNFVIHWNETAMGLHVFPIPILVLFLVMLPKAHLTSHSSMTGSMWVITPLWLSGSLRPFLYSSVYSSHLFLIFSASVRSFPFLSFIVPIFVWNVSLVFPIFLTRSLVFLILFSSVQFSCSVVSDSLWPHGLLHARPSCPSPTPGVYSNSCPLSRWYHPTISISVIPFSSCLQSFPASGSFQLSQLFTSCGQSIPFYCFPLFLCIFYLRMLSSLSLLFSGTLHSVR